MMLFHINEASLDASYIDEIGVDLHRCGTAHVTSAPQPCVGLNYKASFNRQPQKSVGCMLSYHKDRCNRA
jgi:hypothetical protein